nr:hypothetical protein [Streptomyces sp. WMMB 714]
MSTIMIIVLIVAVAAVIAGTAYASLAKRGAGNRGVSLRRRFGPEYDRVLARHSGDSKAADHELSERVRRYGTIEAHPLPPHVREQYVTRWAAAQERFVESPQEALAEAERLLAGLAQARGFPGPERPDEHVDALSVHHAHHVEGYRRVHAAAAGLSGTEEMREAMLQARAFFDALAAEPTGRTAGAGKHFGRKGRDRTHRPLTHDGHARRPLLSPRGNAKGREAL